MSFGEEIPLDVSCQTQLVVFFKEITNIFKLLVFHVSVSSDFGQDPRSGSNKGLLEASI